MSERQPDCPTHFTLAIRWWITALLPWLTGCSLLMSVPPPVDSQSLLKSVETGPESLTLEIFQVRIPANDQKLAKKLWSGVDELQLGLTVRRNLVRNGFRAGVLGGALPDVLAKQLNLTSEASGIEVDRVITDESASPRVVRRVIQLNRRDQAAVQASELKDRIHVLISSDNGLHGTSYDQVEAVYVLRAEPAAGQQISLHLTPELQHGELRNRYAGSDQGIFLITPSRERKTFDQLEINVELAAGELLVVGSLPDSTGSLGNAFHGVDLPGSAEQKLVLVRLLQVPPSEILADSRPTGR